ncbi:hypothetical protein [Bradyrhizobium sp. WSM3983]|uniref:hypothetical protein n=1 Tax=Bradyrhizobium sp. WSM3983 TaxID=1038867 RepID=UPI0012EC31B3|nr:hypothetical protein [Bradyrhizobium sp. WSM3983]
MLSADNGIPLFEDVHLEQAQTTDLSLLRGRVPIDIDCPLNQVKVFRITLGDQAAKDASAILKMRHSSTMRLILKSGQSNARLAVTSVFLPSPDLPEIRSSRAVLQIGRPSQIDIRRRLS